MMSHFGLRILSGAIALTSAFVAGAVAQGPSEEEAELRAKALATRRAERDASRAERLPSRPITLRDPVPLPIVPAVPPGGIAAGQSCPAVTSCQVEYEVPQGKTLVVSGLWSATQVRCDSENLGNAPSTGSVVAPWWHCKKSLSFTGKAAGFTGYLFEGPAQD